ncbi:MAG: quinone oxidoreductase Qor [Pseudomonadota bacterium]|jgi:NADPH2:quinone reductase
MSSPFAVYVTAIGGPEVLKPQNIPMPVPKPTEVVIAHTAVAVNFVEIYLRAGQPHSHNPTPPFIPGVSGVGRIVAIGSEVKDLTVGQKATYTNAGVGSYCTHVALPAERVIPVPESLDDVRVAAGLVRALTSQYLLKQMRELKPGTRVLVHAAAGGVGQILVQWAKRLGLIVIATAGSEAKIRTALELGADEAINYRTHDFVTEVNRITSGKGVSVVFDSVGKDTFEGSLKCLEPKGLVVNYGTASGQVEGFALQDLHSKSLWVCRPTLRTYVADRENMLAMSKEAFEILGDPTIRLDIEKLLPLSQASESHRLLEGRTTQGAIVLIPDDLFKN